jgi:hypothetical protein
MIKIPEILANFFSISLEEMDTVRLLDRIDTKYVFQREQLPEILEQCRKDYKALSIAGSRFSRYETHYFDTPDYKMYLQHHNGKLNRHKVRFREYVDSGLNFFEIKFKNNKYRTIKSRVKLPEHNLEITGKSEELLLNKTNFNVSDLQDVMQVNYNRITLVRMNMTERLTIDYDLRFTFRGTTKSYPNLVIAEVKQDCTSKSPFTALMMENHIRSLSISKYCLGIACLNPTIKSNNFKYKLLTINKLCHEKT